MNRRILLRAGGSIVLALFSVACINIPIYTSQRGPDMRLETLIPAQRFLTADKVLLVTLDGILTDEPASSEFFAEPSELVALKDVLKRAERDPSIRSVVLRINSPGGSVTASDLIYRELTQFKEKTGKKITVICLDVAASGAYYAAMSGDEIIAVPTSVIGSIGVVAFFPRLQELGRKIGLDIRVIKSGDRKDMGSMWREFQPEEREIFQNLINSMHERFLSVVAEGRPSLSQEQIRKAADGRIYTAQEAKELGLVDAIGYMEDAFESAKRLAEVKDAALVAYTSRYGYQGHYYAYSSRGAARVAGARSDSGAGVQVNLLNLDLADFAEQFRGPFHYLWMP